MAEIKLKGRKIESEIFTGFLARSAAAAAIASSFSQSFDPKPPPR